MSYRQETQSPHQSSFRSHGSRPDAITPNRSERLQETPKSHELVSQEILERTAKQQNFNVKLQTEEYLEKLPQLQSQMKDLEENVKQAKVQVFDTKDKMNAMYNEIPQMVNTSLESKIDELRNFLANQNSWNYKLLRQIQQTSKEIGQLSQQVEQCHLKLKTIENSVGIENIEGLLSLPKECNHSGSEDLDKISEDSLHVY